MSAARAGRPRKGGRSQQNHGQSTRAHDIHVQTSHPGDQTGISTTSDKENSDPGLDVTLNGRERRTVRATSRVDPALAQMLRPGHVRLNSKGPDDDQVLGDEVDDTLLLNQQREQGLLSDDDDSYSDTQIPRRKRQRTAASQQTAHSGTSSQSTQGSDMWSSNAQVAPPVQFTASVRHVSSPGPTMLSAAARLDALRGHQHTLPSMSAPPEVGSPIPNLMDPLTPHLPAWLSLTSRASLAPGQSSSQIHSAVDVPLVSNTTPPAASSVNHVVDDAVNSEEDERTLERTRKRAQANAKRRRYKHYSALDTRVRKVMRYCGTLLQAMFSTQAPYPDPDEEDAMIADAFGRALETFKRSEGWYTLTTDDEKLLRQEDTNIRSRVAREALARVPAAYGLHTNPKPEQRVQNQNRAKFLLSDSRFHYENIQCAEGRFQHPVIRQIIELVWFGHSNALGCLFQDLFNPIPNETIALVLTAIQYVLTMYKDNGRKTNTFFKASAYKRYDEYLTALQQFDEGLMRPIWARYRRQLFVNALAHADTKEEVHEESAITLAPQSEIAREYARLCSQAPEDDDGSSPAVGAPVVDDPGSNHDGDGTELAQDVNSVESGSDAFVAPTLGAEKFLDASSPQDSDDVQPKVA